MIKNNNNKKNPVVQTEICNWFLASVLPGVIEDVIWSTSHSILANDLSGSPPQKWQDSSGEWRPQGRTTRMHIATTFL